MSYAASKTWIAGEAWLSADLANNFAGARDYLNAGIVTADFDLVAFDSGQFADGYPHLSWDDHAFETGGMYIAAQTTNDTTQRRYITGLIKNSDVTQQVLYIDIPGSSKRVWLDAGADLWVEGYGYMVVIDPNDNTLAYTAKTTPTPNMVDSRVYLEVDGVVIEDTVNYCFAENTGSPSAQSIAFNMGNMAGGPSARRPVYIMWCATNLSAGWHTVRLVCNPRSEIMFLGTDSWQWEVLSFNGSTGYVGSDKIPAPR